MSARRSHRSARRFPLAVAVIGLLLAALAGATPAFAEAAAPHWKIESRAAPTNLPLEHGGTPGEGVIEVTLANLGDADVNGAEAGKEVKITDKLPAGLEATEVVGESHGNIKSETRNISPADGLRCSAAPTNPILCTFKRTLPPYEQLEIFIRVKVKLQAPSEPSNEVTVEGGGAKPESLGRKLKVNGKATAFGVEQYELAPENEDGSTDTQAGSHPYQLTTTFNLNQTLALDVFENRTEPSAPALQKNLDFALPPGLIGNANALPKCSEFDFGVHGENETNDCPAETAVGVATVTFNDPVLLLYDKATVPVFNLAPAPGEPARFGFTAARVPITLNTSVRTGGDYGVTVSVEDSSAAVQVLGSIVTIWGVPEEESHDSARGWDCLEHVTRPVEPCEQHLKFPQPAPFLSLPTSCSGPPVTSVTGTSYPNTDGEVSKIVAGEENTSYSFRSAFSGCELLDFSPTITVEPEIHEASTPTGLKVHVHVPQTTTLEAKGLAESAVKDTTVKLPSGVQLNPGAANGLEACSEEETGGYEQEGRHVQGGVGFTGSQELEPESEKGARTDTFTEKLPEPLEPGTNFCPNGSKVGVVHIKTPDLPNELEGGVYLARQNANPFGSLFAMYMVAQDPVSKVLVKLAGEVHVSETGQITSTFKNTPDVAFEELTLELFGGPRASLSTPPSCGTYTPEAAFTPWSSTKEEEHKPPVEPFKITSGQGGGGCPPSPLSFSPSVQAGTTNNQAGQYTPFTLTISKPDGQQALESVETRLPPGLAGKIAAVTPCANPQSIPTLSNEQPPCGPESLIGHTTSVSGLGKETVTLPGSLYLTKGLDGAPFGLLASTHAKAGPFDLGYVNVLSTISVNETTAAVSTKTISPIPRFIKGVPAQLRTINVTVERPGNAPFQFNPTNCEELKINGELKGYEGGSSAISQPFFAANCQGLTFAPTLTATAQGHGSKANGTAFIVKLESAGIGQANIHKVDLTIPAALPSRLTTIQKACLESVFNANPAACDEGSVIGEGIVHTPVLNEPLRGPAYLVSHGGAAFPDVEFVLQGEGIKLVLDGKTDIKNGITYSRFETSPDAPFTTFESIFPAGPHSALTANVPEKEDFSLCKKSLTMPTTIVGQNGAVIEQTTKIGLIGCGAVLVSKAHKLTNAQLLAKALHVCRTKYKAKSKKSKRVACEKAARKKYPVKAAKSSKKKKAKKKR